MTCSSNAAIGRRAVSTVASRWFNLVALVVLALFGMAWSGQSLAQSCDFVNVDPSLSQSGPAGGTLTYTFQAQTACSPTVTGTIAITSDTTGGATAPTTFTATLDTDESFTLTLGPTPGGTGTVTVTCLTGGCTGDTIVYTFNTNNQFVHTAATPVNITANQITPFTVGTNLQLNGGPAGLGIAFNNLSNGANYGTSTPDAAGTATTTQSSAIAGTYTVRGSVVCPTAFVLQGCAAVPPIDFTVVVEPVSLQAISPLTANTTSGTPVNVIVRYGSASIPAPNGSNITWTLSGPSGSDGVLTGNPVAGGAGQATATFSATVPGTYTVFANSGCTFCAPGSQIFTINVTAPPFVLTPVTASPASGTAGVPMPLTVRLEQGGAPVAGATIQWTATAPFAPAATTSLTNAANGDATASFTPSTFGNFTNAITALFDPDGIPASGDELTVSYDANIAFVASLGITGGNNQNALVNTAYALPLQVTALNSGIAAPGVTINWAITGGAGTLSSNATVTSATGAANITVTSGATPGPLTITATRQDDPAATVTFTLTVEALGSLTIVGGDNQLLGAGVTSAPLQVALENAAGNPVAGAVVSWTTSGGTLASATSTTNAAGIASNTVTTTSAGSLQVTASSPLSTAPAVFALNGELSSLSGLTPEQQSIAEAIDSACPALAALPTRTAGQQDLYARCQELIVAAGLDPGAAVNAINQLMTDVALAQGNASMSAAQSQFQNLKTRIAALRSGTNGTDFGGLAFNTSAGPISLGMLAGALAPESSATEVGTDFSRWGFFAAGTIGRGEMDPGDINPAYDYDIDGITLGVDYRQSDKWIIGGSLGYTRQDTDLPDGRGGVETRGFSVSAYSTFYQQDSWYADGVLTWGRNNFEMLRRITYTVPTAGGGTRTIDQEAGSDSDGDLLSTAFTVGRDFNRGALGIGPYARVLYTRLDFDSINEELLPGLPGSGLGLRVEERSLSSLASVLGTKFTYTHSTDWGVLMPHLQLEWEHEFRDDPQAIEARFLNDPTGSAMLVRGDPLDTDYFRLGLGLSMVLSRGRSGFLYYEHLLGRDGMSQYSLALGLRLEF
ncbi:autotransporter domain-containing protein [Arenimonas sp. MALMAid1274]|uniref:autotransporter domain-containing protein n=1 Tax=Arenimonas sp. MALMAid1274 TaxID=3411630 RepID=UPI003BA33800